MRFFKNDEQEIKVLTWVTIISLLIYIILSTLREFQ